MAIIVSSVATTLEQNRDDALDKAAARLGIPHERIRRAEIVKTSLDARKKNRIQFVHTVRFCLDADEEKLVAAKNDPQIRMEKAESLSLEKGTAPLFARPVIVGFGPAGMFAGLLLAEQGYRPVILERGSDMDERTKLVDRFWKTGALSAQTNVQFGEGGAGTFSDGKLTTRIGDARCGWVTDALIRFGAPEQIRCQAKPHIGTDLLRQVVKNIRLEIIRLGGEVIFNTMFTGIQADVSGRIKTVSSTSGQFEAGVLVLAAGHSARDTFEMLASREFAMQPKAFSVGVRIEHLQAEIDKALYGSYAGHPALPAGEYQLSHRVDGRGTYTFCMCPGGYVVPAASEEGGVVTNGMSDYARDGVNANSAVVVSVDPKDFGEGTLDGVRFQRELERAAFAMGGRNYTAPAQDMHSFLAGKSGLEQRRVAPSYQIGVTAGEFHALFPAEIYRMLCTGLQAFHRKLPGFAADDALLTGVETRTSSPVRILRGENLQSPSMAGVFPCGEGAGYAGGIMSAAVDGIRVAQEIIREYAPSEK